jgi:hypothetical protein
MLCIFKLKMVIIELWTQPVEELVVVHSLLGRGLVDLKR